VVIGFYCYHFHSGVALFFGVMLLPVPDPNNTNLVRLFDIEPVQKRQIKGGLRQGLFILAA
jgi:hypothetical protein